MTTLSWKYPVTAAYYSAMAALASVEYNLSYFLMRATSMTPHSLRLAKHNIELHTERQASAIGFASIPESAQ